MIFNSVMVSDAATGATVAMVPVGVTPVGVTVNTSGTRVYVANRGSGTVSTIDAATNQVIGTTAVGASPQQLALSADGNRLYVTNTGDGTVSVMDTQTLANIATVPVGPGPNAITLSRDGSLAYVVNGNDTMSVINTATNTKVTGTVPIQAGAFGGVTVGPDGTAYVANSSGNAVRAVSLVHVDPPPLTGDPGAGPLFEDFSGPAGAEPDPSVFNRESGFGGAGVVSINTLDPANGSLDGNGNLVITARNEPVQDQWGNTWNYTSTGYDTKDKFEFTYGTVSTRVKVPAGQGLHTTIALFGSDIDQIGWPNAGEVDIFELYNSPASSGSALHGPGHYNVDAPAPVNVADGQFHTVWVKWEPNKITTGIDDQVTRVFTPDDLPPGAPWTFNDRSMYLVYSLEVGGSTQPDATTPFPSSIVVDSLEYEPLTQSTGTATTVV